MKTILKKEPLCIKAAKMNGESSLPSLSDLNFTRRSSSTALSEYEGLFVGYGHNPSAFPYKMQDLYDRETQDETIDTYILENDHIKAVFVPSLGGKLYRLYDKDSDRDILYTNPVIRPCNLALRNAWTSGGIEFNCGVFGHSPFTCSPVFTAETTTDEGYPVLRIYEFERIRQLIYQVDFFLPDDSRQLYARMRVTNPRPTVVPCYWWTNIAVPETPETRIILPADLSYVAENNIDLVDIQDHEGKDVTYPYNVASSRDYFYKIPYSSRKFECAVGKDGYGFMQTSTHRLIGRKLFCWGQNPGGDRWQEYLSYDGSKDRYVELQAGLCHSQYESIPMPPYTTWEWLEGYSAVQLDPEIAHGPWRTAKKEAFSALDHIITDDKMEELLYNTRTMSKRPASVLSNGSGWGALEKYRRSVSGEKIMCPHLDFGEMGKEQLDWKTLIDTGHLPDRDPNSVIPSWMIQDEFIHMLEDAVKKGSPSSWYEHLEIAASLVAKGKLGEGVNESEISLSLKRSPWAYYTEAAAAKTFGNADGAAEFIVKGASIVPDDISLAVTAMNWLTSAGKYREAQVFADSLPERIKTIGRIKLSIIMANIHEGNIDIAEKTLCENGGLIVADIREGENIITELWFLIQEAKSRKNGISFSRDDADVPAIFDYRATKKFKGPKN